MVVFWAELKSPACHWKIKLRPNLAGNYDLQSPDITFTVLSVNTIEFKHCS